MTTQSESTNTTTRSKINSNEFYGEYHGHKVKHLEILLPTLRNNSDAIIWTAGDSSLDNKYWFHNIKNATSNGYSDVLDPPMSNTDITYWMNDIVVNDANDSSTTADEGNNSIKYGTINTAVEATTLNQRTYHLLPQDKFIRDNIKEDDVLIVSIGGNDIALAPTPCTIISILSLICCVPYTIVDRGHACCSLPIDDYCYGCCTSFLSCFGACPPCLGYFRHLFCTRVQKYVEALTSKTKPKKVLVCMIYYPDESNTPSWANTALTALGYNSNPEKLQMLIRKIFEEAIR